jgi:diguanylate cyclase (GGDEF)-like protein
MPRQTGDGTGSLAGPVTTTSPVKVSGMRGLSVRAKAYLAFVALAAAGAMLWTGSTERLTGSEWAIVAGLACIASLAQLFEVRTPNNKAYNGTIAFLLTAALIVPPLGAVVATAVPFVVEQLRKPKTLYIQVFNLSSHVLSTLAAAVAYSLVVGAELGSPPVLDGAARSVLGCLVALLAFLVVNHVTLVVALWWARGVQPRETGLLGVEGLLTDAALLAMGCVVAALWAAGAPFVLFALVPLALIQRALYFPELQHASRTDAKTGLLNSTYFTEVAEDELRRAVRIGHPLAVLVADLDLLRNINNAYGHLAGDVVLRGVADILREEVREYDVVSRFGGEEFAVLLPAADLEEARQVAERIRGRVAREAFDVETSVQPISVTLSVGVAVVGEHGATVKELLHSADLAVYRAKLEGRDRVRVARADDDVTTAPTPAPRVSPVTRLMVAEVPPLAPARGASAEPHPRVPEPAPPRTAPRPQLARRGRTWPVTVTLAVVTVVVAPLVLLLSPPFTTAVIVLPLLALAAELSGENIYGSGFVSLSAVPILTGVATGRPAAAMLAGAVSGLAGSLAGRVRLEQAVFNTANLVLCASIASGVRLTVDLDELRPADLPTLAGVMLVATFVYFLLDNGLVALAIGQDEGRDPFRVFREDFAWLAPHFLVFGMFGALLGVAWETYGLFGVAAFLLPPIMVRVAQRQYLARTTSNVAELRRLADDLAASKSEIEASNVALENALVAVRERHLATAQALAGAIDARDKTTGGHIERVSALGQAMCEVVDPLLASDPQIVFGFLLHDVGKIGVPDSVLLKEGPLDPAERLVIERHPEIGEALLADAGFSDAAREIVFTHHERWDGTGYPRGLKGTEIPLCSRLFAVADSLDAMTNDRPYRKGIALDEAYDELRRHSGSQFDPMAVEALLALPVERVQELLRLGRDETGHAAALARMIG